jgi:hypothetical protein
MIIVKWGDIASEHEKPGPVEISELLVFENASVCGYPKDDAGLHAPVRFPGKKFLAVHSMPMNRGLISSQERDGNPVGKFHHSLPDRRDSYRYPLSFASWRTQLRQ